MILRFSLSQMKNSIKILVWIVILSVIVWYNLKNEIEKEKKKLTKHGRWSCYALSNPIPCKNTISRDSKKTRKRKLMNCLLWFSILDLQRKHPNPLFSLVWFLMFRQMISKSRVWGYVDPGSILRFFGWAGINRK